MDEADVFGKLDLAAGSSTTGSAYPPPYDRTCRDRNRTAIGNLAGLTQFGVNRLELPPGAWSSQRHWHSEEDEFVWVLEGEVILVIDAGEQVLRSGDCAGFKAGVPNGHHLQNRASRTAVVLEIGSRRPDHDRSTYSDIDLQWSARDGFKAKSG